MKNRQHSLWNSFTNEITKGTPSEGKKCRTAGPAVPAGVKTNV